MNNQYETSSNLIKDYLNEHKLNDFKNEEYEQMCENFKKEFSPEILEQLSGIDVLNTIFPHDGDKTTLCYYLEFGKQYFNAGSIAGGSTFKFSLFKYTKTNNWTLGTSIKNLRGLDINEAIDIAIKVRDALVEGARYIQSSKFDIIEDYKNLEHKLNNLFEDPFKPTHSWIHKYYALIFPEIISNVHSDNKKRELIKILNIEPEETYYGIDGQCKELSKKSNIKLYSLFNKEIQGLFIKDEDLYLTVDEWIEALENDNLVSDKMLDVLEIYYNSQNYSTSYNEISKIRAKQGFDEKSYNSIITSTSKNVKKYFNKSQIYDESNKEIFWPRLFNGENNNNRFIFTLREELINALSQYDKTKRKYITNEIQAKKFNKTQYDSFYDYLYDKGYYFDKKIIEDYLLSLKVKPFVILTGKSGTGKTKLSQLFAQYLNQNDNYKIIPVGANWTENRHILGYFNIIKNEPQYTPAYYLIKKSQSESYPHFLILDEMNLSHVERYFADFLSAIESNESIPLYGEEELEIPYNLFIIGTVNVDETTYMFSPKVLDRANTIEFETYNAKNYMNNKFNLQKPKGNVNYLEDILDNDNVLDMNIKELKEFFANDEFWEILSDEIFKFQEILKSAGFDFGFRVINEIVRFMAVSYKYEREPENWDNWQRYFDAQIKQKMLPKLHGSQKVIGETLDELLKACEDYPSSKAKLEEMIDVLAKQRYVSFIN